MSYLKYIFGKNNKETMIKAMCELNKPSDLDIENAAVDYLDEIDKEDTFNLSDIQVAYQQGAIDMRNNQIYISPIKKNSNNAN